METNPYFAYSLRSDISGDTSSSGESGHIPKNKLPPFINTTINRNPKRGTSRACDSCSIRKIKCDNSRPCEQCVVNGVKCTELRVRKKSGPKSLRKKTMDTIKSVANDFSGVAADRMLMEQLDSGAIYPDLTPLVKHLASIDSRFLREIVPFTTPDFNIEALQEIACLHECPRVMGFSAKINALRYAVTTLCLILLKATSLKNKPVNYAILLRDLQIYILSSKAACDRFLSFGSGAEKLSFETHYYLALAELHQFSYLVMEGVSPHLKYVNFQTAIAHHDALEPQDECDLYRKFELRLTLWVLEQHMILIGPDKIFRNNRAKSFLVKKFSDEFLAQARCKCPFLVSYSALLGACDLLQSGKAIPEPFELQVTSTTQILTSDYELIKLQIESIHLLEPLESMPLNLLACTLLFKALAANSHVMTKEEVSDKLLEIVERVNRYFYPQANIEVFMSIFNVTTVFLEILVALIRLSSNPETIDSLIQFTSTLTDHIKERHKQWSKDPLIEEWFARALR